jgi:hypothetical protein
MKTMGLGVMGYSLSSSLHLRWKFFVDKRTVQVRRQEAVATGDARAHTQRQQANTSPRIAPLQALKVTAHFIQPKGFSTGASSSKSFPMTRYCCGCDRTNQKKLGGFPRPLTSGSLRSAAGVCCSSALGAGVTATLLSAGTAALAAATTTLLSAGTVATAAVGWSLDTAATTTPRSTVKIGHLERRGTLFGWPVSPSFVVVEKRWNLLTSSARGKHGRRT